MRRRILPLLLGLVLLLTGCCTVDEYSGWQFWEAPGILPEFPQEEYLPIPSPFGGSAYREPIPEPEVDLDALPDRAEDDLVLVTDYIPDIVVSLKYATSDNYTGQVIYDYTDLYLRYGTVEKLMRVQKELRMQGLVLKVWDGFRSVSAQESLWTANPDPSRVVDPSGGYSDFTRGNTIAVTLVDGYGMELEMPSGFDNLTALADRNYGDCSESASENARLLQSVMEKYGFSGAQDVWWQYTDDTEYGPETRVDPGVMDIYYADCKEYINIRVSPDVTAEVIGHIPAMHKFTVLGWNGLFSYVEYNGVRGYVNSEFAKPAVDS